MFTKVLKSILVSAILLPTVSVAEFDMSKLSKEEQSIMVEYFSDIIFMYDQYKDPYMIKEVSKELTKDERIYLYKQLLDYSDMSKKHRAIFKGFIKDLENQK